MTRIYQEQLPNGLWLVAEPSDSAQSLSMTLMTPAGCAHEPQGLEGVAAVLEEMLPRGACGMDARAHCQALDQLGVQRSTQVETRHLRLSATMIADKLAEALPLLTGMVTSPNLDEKALEPARDLAMQAIRSLDDEPQHKVMLDLRARHFPPPLGRSPMGTESGVAAVTPANLRDFWRKTCVPYGSILAFAGKLDWAQLRDLVDAQLADWTGSFNEPQPDQAQARGYQHAKAETAQMHIALAYDAPPEPDEHSMLQRAAVAALSGGMSGRLFTEVREKRGLCYAVYATYAAGRDRGAVFGYAGTTTPRAQETLDVMANELRRLSQGIDESEFARAIVGMKSNLVMQGESTGARAGSIANDQYLISRPRSLAELAERVDAITLDALNRYLRDHPPGEFTVATIGPEALQVESVVA